MTYFTREFYQKKLEEFNNLFPSVNATFIFHCDWSDDLGVSTQEAYTLSFCTTKLKENKGEIEYFGKGMFEKRLDMEKFFKKESIGGSVYVYNYEEDKKRYVFLDNKPWEKFYPGCASYEDFTFKVGELLIYYEKLKDKELKDNLINFTKNELDKKYESVSKIAIIKNYKHGWIFHQMKKSIYDVDKAWADAGGWFAYEPEAYKYMFNFQYNYRKESLKEEL